MKLGYFPYVLYRDLDSTRGDDVEGLALVALPDDVRAVELVPVCVRGRGDGVWSLCLCCVPATSSRRCGPTQTPSPRRSVEGRDAASSLLVHRARELRELRLRDAVR